MFALALAACQVDPHTPCAADVPAAFAAIAPEPAVAVIADGDVDFAFRYTLTPENGYGVDNHLQGLARLGRWLFVSGGDIHGPRADLFVADLDEGRFVAAIELDSGDEWHAGGLGLLDGVLAVPTEDLREQGDRTASVRLFDVADPLAAGPLSVVPRSPVAHAAGLARTGDAFLLVSWDDAALAFFRSPDLSAFPDAPFATVPVADVEVATEEAGDPGVHGQAVSLVNQCDGAVFAITTQNTQILPVSGGTDYADLFAVDVDGDTVAVTKLASRALACPPDQGCNFAAAGGAWVDDDGGVRIASVPHYRDPTSGTLSYAEFSAP